MDAAGANQTRLTYIGRHNWFPAWSPDGALIVYESERQGNRDLYVIDLADPEPSSILLTDSPAIDSAPRWSPDGRYIAFVSNRTGNEEIFILTLDGSDDYSLFNLTNHLANDRNPMWDPAGKRITFESYEDGKFELVVINLDGTGRQQLTHDDQLGHQFSWQP
jgi:Tol biopolymer transport system component